MEQIIKALEFVLNDQNSSLDYETRLILEAALAKAKGELK